MDRVWKYFRFEISKRKCYGLGVLEINFIIFVKINSMNNELHDQGTEIVLISYIF